MDVSSFVRDLTPAQIPADVMRQTQTCLLDLAAVAIAGSRTPMSGIVRDHVSEHYGTSSRAVRLLADGRRASPVGAALAGAATIDSLDAHDGHDLTKGHAGVAVLPAVLAFADLEPSTAGAELLTRVVLGYEVGTRAGIALHATAADYHSSGAWNALAAAAVGARSLGLDAEQIDHALGIAEYQAPRSPMLRCIDHPTMVKDGSAWGAAAGVSAALLAADGFTGAPAHLTTMDEVADVWHDLGSRWRILEQYVKPYPVCRWAHPAVQAALTLTQEHRLTAADVVGIEVTTFDPATRLATRCPDTTEQAQYSLPFAVGLAVSHHRVDPDLITGSPLTDPVVLRLSRLIDVREDPELSRQFPHKRLASVRLTLTDGRDVASALTEVPPLTEADIRTKALAYTAPVVGEDRAQQLLRIVDELPIAPSVEPLLDALLSRGGGYREPG